MASVAFSPFTLSIRDSSIPSVQFAPFTISLVPPVSENIESIDASIYMLPARDNGYPWVLYRNNTNRVVVDDIINTFTLSSVSVSSITLEIRGTALAHVYGPVELIQSVDGRYYGAIPHGLDLSDAADQATLIVRINTDDGSQGYFEKPLAVESRIN